LRNTKRFALVVATQRPMSSSTASSVVADSQIVPGAQACSFDFVYDSVGSNQASTSSPTSSIAASATAVATTSRSTAAGADRAARSHRAAAR
jgi:hypothetical protein